MKHIGFIVLIGIWIGSVVAIYFGAVPQIFIGIILNER